MALQEQEPFIDKTFKLLFELPEGYSANFSEELKLTIVREPHAFSIIMDGEKLTIMEWKDRLRGYMFADILLELYDFLAKRKSP
jgi:hypothetical protein